MSTDVQDLTEREKQTLRLIVRGHDAKSAARHLGLSVHTVNERLRDARRKLQVSSSREAARLLLDSEDPQNAADKLLGDADAAAPAPEADLPAAGTVHAWGGAPRLPWLIAGVTVMSVILGILALAAVPQSTGQSASPAAAATAPIAETEAVQAARNWLELHDAARWRETWDGMGAEMRRANSFERWAEVAQSVRVPMGALVSRTAMSQDSVPAAPAGAELVKFRTRFANKPDAVETVSLARENGTWKVVGIYID